MGGGVAQTPRPDDTLVGKTPSPSGGADSLPDKARERVPDPIPPAASPEGAAPARDIPRAGPPQPPPAALPAPAREALAEEGIRLIRMDGGRADIRLDPPELGQVRMTVSVGEGGVSIHIAAERGETLDLLRRHSELLMQLLRGEAGGSLEASFGSAERQVPAGAAVEAGRDPEPDDADPPIGPNPAIPAGRLDLRL